MCRTLAFNVAAVVLLGIRWDSDTLSNFHYCFGCLIHKCKCLDLLLMERSCKKHSLCQALQQCFCSNDIVRHLFPGLSSEVCQWSKPLCQLIVKHLLYLDACGTEKFDDAVQASCGRSSQSSSKVLSRCSPTSFQDQGSNALNRPREQSMMSSQVGACAHMVLTVLDLIKAM